MEVVDLEVVIFFENDFYLISLFEVGLVVLQGNGLVDVSCRSEDFGGHILGHAHHLLLSTSVDDRVVFHLSRLVDPKQYVLLVHFILPTVAIGQARHIHRDHVRIARAKHDANQNHPQADMRQGASGELESRFFEQFYENRCIGHDGKHACQYDDHVFPIVHFCQHNDGCGKKYSDYIRHDEGVPQGLFVNFLPPEKLAHRSEQRQHYGKPKLKLGIKLHLVRRRGHVGNPTKAFD